MDGQREDHTSDGTLRTASSCAAWVLGTIGSAMLTGAWYPAVILVAPVVVVALAAWVVVLLHRRAGASASQVPSEERQRSAYQIAWDVLLAVGGCTAVVAALAVSALAAWGLRPPTSNAWDAVYPYMGTLGYVSAACVLLGLLWHAEFRDRPYRLATLRLMVVGGWFGLLIVLGLPVHLRDVVGARKATCLARVKDLAQALQMYASDNGERLPLAADWQDILQREYRGGEVFTCPEAPGQASAFAYNATLNGVALPHLADPEAVVAIFESDAGRNDSGDHGLLPDVPRHLGGDNYGFADGHAAWAKRKAWGTDRHGNPNWLKEPERTEFTWRP